MANSALGYKVIQPASYILAFDNTDLSDGVLTVTHNFGHQYPSFPCVTNNEDKVIVPDSISFVDINTLTICVSSFGTITGTWKTVILDSGASVAYDTVSDTAYAASWDGVTNIAPSKNAVYDQMQLQMLKNGSNLAIGSDADGDMYYRASGALARLAKGAANYKLCMNAGATAPEWASGGAIIYATREMDAATGDVDYTIGFTPSVLITLGSCANSPIWCAGFSYAITEFCIFSIGSGLCSNGAGYLLVAYEAAGKNQNAVVKTLGSTTTLTWTRLGATAGGTFAFFLLALR